LIENLLKEKKVLVEKNLQIKFLQKIYTKLKNFYEYLKNKKFYQYLRNKTEELLPFFFKDVSSVLPPKNFNYIVSKHALGKVYIPIFTSISSDFKNQNLEGIIVLGEKASENSFQEREFHFLANIGLQARFALDRIPHVKEIQDARLRAEQADQFKTELLDMLSHELRTPFTQIIGGNKKMDIQLQKDLDAPLSNLINTLKKNSKKMTPEIIKEAKNQIKQMKEMLTNIFQPSLKSTIKSAERLFDRIDNILKAAALKANKSNLTLEFTQFSEI